MVLMVVNLNGLRPISQDVNNVYLILDHYLNGFQSLQVLHRGLYWDPFCFYYTFIVFILYFLFIFYIYFICIIFFITFLLTIYHFVPDLAKSHYLRMTSKIQREF